MPFTLYEAAPLWQIEPVNIKGPMSARNLYSFFVLFLLSLSLCLVGCAEKAALTVEEKYDKAILMMEKGEYGIAEPIFSEIIRESPGTRYANFAYLKMGDAGLASTDSKDRLDIAEINYRHFLRQNPNHHLVPYVLSRLIELNVKRNQSSLFGKSYAYARDPGHFKVIVSDYQSFYLLFPRVCT